MIIIARCTTHGTPVEDPDGGPFDIGYDDLRSDIVFFPSEDHMADWVAEGAEELLAVNVLCEVESIGL
jgi:hypothetical protein